MSYSPRISFNPMSFGNERELDIALTELQWIKKNKGKLKNSDFQTVSEKYCFPIDFLKKGISGFSYPDDFLVSKSKWFPILYSWVVLDNQYSINLYKLQFSYLRTKFIAITFLGLLAGIFYTIGYFLQSYFNFGLWDTINLALVFILSFMGLYVEFKNNLSNCKTVLDEYLTNLKDKGLGYIVEKNEKFIRENYNLVIHAPTTILKKIRSAHPLTLIYMGTKEKKKKENVTLVDRILRKIPLYPKTSPSAEKEKIPVFYAENPFVEYKKRIEELVESKPVIKRDVKN